MVQIREGDTVRVVPNAKLAIVKQVGVSQDVESPDNCNGIVRLPDGDTLVLLLWKRGGGPSYMDQPHRYMVVPEPLLQPQ